jgi:aminoglycoside 6'-N-acetyltransferase
MSDMPRLTAWLMEPHVRKFYQPAPITLDEVAAEYAPTIGNDTPTVCHLAVGAGMPFAYVQSYRNLDYPEWAEMIDVRDGISVDLFIGEPSFLHRGFGRAMPRAYFNQVALAHFAAETRAYIAHATGRAARAPGTLPHVAHCRVSTSRAAATSCSRRTSRSVQPLWQNDDDCMSNWRFVRQFAGARDRHFDCEKKWSHRLEGVMGGQWRTVF